VPWLPRREGAEEAAVCGDLKEEACRAAMAGEARQQAFTVACTVRHGINGTNYQISR